MPYSESSYMADIEIRSAKFARYFSRRFDPDNLHQAVTRGSLNPISYQFITDLIDSLDAIYPDMYDIEFKFQPIYKTITNTYGSNHHRAFPIFDKFLISSLEFTIRFEEIKISNANNESHTIKDLFVRVPVQLPKLEEDKYSLKFGVLNGMRSTISYAEFIKGYSHSHLGTRNFTNSENRLSYSNFCIGGGDIRAIMQIINTGDYDMETLQLYLLSIRPYIEWESLEGGPYVVMGTLTQKTYNIDVPRISAIELFYSVILGQFMIGNLKDKDISKLNWDLERGIYSLKTDEVLEDFLINIAQLPNYAKSFKAFLFMKDEAGHYYKMLSEFNNAEIPEKFTNYIMFRGEKITFKVEGHTNQGKNIQKKLYVHPAIKNYVRNKFNKQVNYSKIRQAALSQQD